MLADVLLQSHGDLINRMRRFSYINNRGASVFLIHQGVTYQLLYRHSIHGSVAVGGGRCGRAPSVLMWILPGRRVTDAVSMASVNPVFHSHHSNHFILIKEKEKTPRSLLTCPQETDPDS